MPLLWQERCDRISTELNFHTVHWTYAFLEEVGATWVGKLEVQTMLFFQLSATPQKVNLSTYPIRFLALLVFLKNEQILKIF